MPAARTRPSSQPTDLCTFTIQVEGEAIPPDVQVTNIVVLKEINKIPSVRLRMTDGDPSSEEFKVSSGETFIPGKNIEIMNSTIRPFFISSSPLLPWFNLAFLDLEDGGMIYRGAAEDDCLTELYLEVCCGLRFPIIPATS